MGLKWKSWKYELKRDSYDPSLNIDEIVAAQTDSRVDILQFKKLVTRWFKDKTQAESEKNKKIRSKFKEPHVMGTKSFARLIDEEKKKNNGVQPSRGAIYRKSRTRKNGRIVNAFATEVIDKLRSILDASSGTSEGNTREGVIDWKNDDLAKVKGPEKGGRVRCLGKVVMPKYKETDSSQDPQVPLLQARVIHLEDHIKDIMEKQAAEMKEMKEKQEAEMKEMKEKQAAEMKQMKTTQDFMFQFMATINKHMPHLDLSNIFNEAHNDSCSAYVNPRPTSSRASQNTSG